MMSSKALNLARIRLTGAQLRAARGLLNMSAAALSQATHLDTKTIWRAEETDGPVRITVANAECIISALEQHGVELIQENGRGVGVRLRAIPSSEGVRSEKPG